MSTLTVGELTGFVDLDTTGITRGAASGEAATARMSRNVLAQLRKIEAEKATVKLDADIGAVERNLAAAHSQMEAWEALDAEARAGVDIDGGRRNIAALEAELARLRMQRVQIEVDLDENKVHRFTAALDGARGKTDKLAGSLSKLGPAALAFSGAGLVPVLMGTAAAAASVQGVLGLLPAVAFAGATGIGALKVATAGFGDALSSMDDPAKFAEALEELSPAARGAATAIRSMVPAWKEMQQSVQERFFVGLGEKMSALTEDVFPMLANSFGTVADGANMAAGGVLDMLNTVNRLDDLESILGSGAAAFTNLLAAVRPIVEALMDIGVVGGGVLAELTAGVGGAAQRFADFIAQARQTGQLEAWIRSGVAAFGDLMGILGNLGRLVGSVFQAANMGGAGLLETVRQLTAGWAQWASSAEGQERMGEVFGALNEILSTTSGVMGTLLPIIADIIVWFSQLPGPVQSAVVGFVAWGSIIGKLAGMFGPLLSVLGFLGPKIATVGGSIVAGAAKWGLLGNAARMAGAGVDGSVGKILAVMAKGAVMMMGHAIRMAASWIVAMGPIGWIIAAVVALVALIIMNWDTVKAATIAVWQGICNFFTTAWEWIVNAVKVGAQMVLDFLIQWGPLLLAIITGPLGMLVYLVVTYWDQIVAAVQAAADWVVNLLTAAWTMVTAAASAAWQWLVGIVTGAWAGIVAAVQAAGAAVVGFLANTWATVQASASAVWNWLVGLISGVWASITGAVSSAASSVVNFLSNAWSNVKQVASSSWDAILSTIRNAGSNAVSFVASLPGRFLSALSSLGSLLVGVGHDLVMGLWNGISAGWSWLTDAVSSLATNLLNAAKSALGIGSPSKEFRREVGHWIPAGLGDGIIANAKAATDAARQVARAATDAATAEAQVAARAASDAARTIAVDYGSVSDATWDRLLDLGYKGRAGDSREALYVPQGVLDQATGQGGGVQVTINNPLPERSSSDLNRRARTLAKLGG